MVTIPPITYSPDALALGRSTDPVFRSIRGQQVPEVLPPAVILPRTAAWLNPVTITPAESVASTETSPDQSNGGQTGSTFVPVAPTGPVAGIAAPANADQSAPASVAATSDTSTPGVGSVLQLV